MNLAVRVPSEQKGKNIIQPDRWYRTQTLKYQA